MKNGVMCYVLAFSLVFITGCAQMAWEKTTETNTLIGYQDFIDQYPDSEHISIAKDRAEELYWKQVQTTDTVQLYEEYVDKYPEGKNKSNALDRLEILVWEQARNSDRISRYEQYLMSQYATNTYIQQAKDRIEELYWKEQRLYNSIDSYNTYLKKYPDGRYVEYAENNIKTLAFNAAKLAELAKQREEFFEKLSSFNEASKMRSFLCSEDAKSFVTEVNITQIEQIIVKHTNFLDSKDTLPAMTAKKDGKRGSGTLRQVGSPLFGTPLTVSTSSGVVGGGSVDGEIGIFYEGRSLLIRTEFPNDLIPTIPGPELFGMRVPEPVMPLAEKSIHRFDGTVIFGGYKFINKGNPLNRLTFLLTENGYIYLRGEGTVLTPAGKKINFPPAEETLLIKQ